MIKGAAILVTGLIVGVPIGFSLGILCMVLIDEQEENEKLRKEQANNKKKAASN